MVVDVRPMSTTSGTIRMPRAEREQQILVVAAGQFAARGFALVTMDEIAREVGVSRLILYRYFSSKDELYRAILLAAALRLGEAMTAAASGGAGESMLRAYVRVAREEEAAYILLFSGGADGPLDASVIEARGAVRAEIERQAVTQATKEGVAPDAIWLPLAASLALALVERGTLAWLRTVPNPTGNADNAFVEYLQRAVSGMLGGVGGGRFALRFPAERLRVQE